MDEDETPKKKQVSTLKSTNTSMNSVLDKLERVDLSVLSPEAVIKAQYFIIQYLKVIFFPLFTWNYTRYVLDINYLPSLQSLVEPKNIPAAVEKTLKVISDYNPASGDHEYDYDQDHMEPPNSPVFNSQSPCTRYDRAIGFKYLHFDINSAIDIWFSWQTYHQLIFLLSLWAHLTQNFQLFVTL